ncbi:HSF-type DNA-binding-domain-containing protein [Chlamydoabsidia padenii]|nr:HSF-type DNA-binding-domain-containing protein [Chlamydoabsidia padenii]
MHHRRTPSNTSTLGSTLGTSSGPSSPPSTTGPYYSNQLLTVQSQPKLSNSTNTFVHKLYNMVLDDQYQHLIAWSYTGASFIVCNIMDFSRDVLPKHFKHNNFSSFVRQLNMYGFHKVNKSPRGHRTLAENQIWEFSHQKFLRGRPELLDDIKRKAMEATDNQQRQVNGDIQAHMNLIQSSQSDMMHQLTGLYENFNHVVKELQETRRKQEAQDHLLRNMMQYICHQNNGK